MYNHHMYTHTNVTKNTTRLACIFIITVCVFQGPLWSMTFPVLNTADAGVGSLRAALDSCWVYASPDTIIFAIPGAGPHTIFVLSQLPPLTDQAGTVVDGFSQPGAMPGGNPPSTANLLIVLDGTNAGPSHGLWVVSSNNTIQGLVIQHFEQDGIRVQATPTGTNFNFVFCNFVGTDQTGTLQRGNGTNQAQLWAGIYIICTPVSPGIAQYNMIDNNLVSCNYAEGIGIANCPPGDVSFNTAFGNYVGTDVTGTQDFGNVHDGVYIGEGAHDNVVDNNLISGNDFDGVGIVGFASIQIFTYGNILHNNIIGLDINMIPLPNTMDGVNIGEYGTWASEGYATDNIIDSNTIAHNGGNGVTVWEHISSINNADRNLITRNSMFNNVNLGIDLGDNGVTFNDAGDPDAGANEELNFPVIAGAYYNPATGSTTVNGTIDIDTDPTLATIELFRATPDPTGYGEGTVFLGATSADAAGNWNITVAALIHGDTVTATTSDANMNTSEFCLCDTVRQLGIEDQTQKSIKDGNRYCVTPNPSHDITFISFGIPAASHVSIVIFDVSGARVNTLVDHTYSAGTYMVHWDGKDYQHQPVPAGIYFCRLTSETYTATRKLIRSP
jgi:hypothetical protein